MTTGRPRPTVAVDAEALAARLPGGFGAVGELTPMTGGATSDIWSFVTGSGRRLVLRRSLRSDAGEPPVALQAACMEAARAAGVPVPEVLAAGEDPVLGPFTIMTLVDGETIPRRVQRDDRLAGARRRFATDAGTILGRLRTVDPALLPGLDRGDPLGRLRERLGTLGVPSATFEWALRHLDETRPPAEGGPARVVHGDFRLGNLIVAPAGVAAVLDWEGVHAGDPLEDLGWLCTKTWRFGGSLEVGGLGTREALLDAYAAAGGPPVACEALQWWELYGSLRWGVICMEQARRHFSGVPSVELAAIGRRVAEVEWDLLGLLP